MNGIRVVRIKTFIARNKGFLLRTVDFLSYVFPAFIAGLCQTKPDVIAATTPQLFIGLTGVMLKFFRRVPFVLEVADIWPASIVSVGAMQKNGLIRCLEKLELFLYRKATAIIVLTAAFKDNLTARGTPAEKITVVINGVDLKKYAPTVKNISLKTQLGIPKDHFVVGYLGTHGMAHGLINVLHTAERLTHEKIMFLFVGAGAERDDLIRYAQSRSLSNVMFLPAQPKASMPQYWSLCDTALIHLKNDPVFAEVIPSKIFEAMGMGLPIILAAPAGEASAIIVKEEAGIWVAPQDPHALATAIVTLQTDSDKKTFYTEKSQLAAVHYSRERQATAMLAVLTAVTDKSAISAGATS